MRRVLPVLVLVSLWLIAAAPPPLAGRKGLVAAEHPLASQAGAEMLARGGNAADAIVAAALAAGIVQPAGSGLGGGGFAVIYDGETGTSIDFREVAPKGASRDMFLDAKGEPVPNASVWGGLAVAVPAEGRGLAEIHKRFGKLPLKVIAEPAIRLSKGFAVGPHLAKAMARSPDIAGLLFDGLTEAPKRGDVVRRARLGKTIAAWAKSGGTALHVGPLADDIASAVQAAGGVLTAEDLAAYQTRERPVLRGTYRGYTILTMAPPSSGGAVLLQVLGVLEGWDLKSLGHNSSEHVHLLAEAMKHAFADRAELMGDPDFVEVPVERMLAPARIDAVRRAIYPSRTFPLDYYGTKVDPPRDAGTHHISVIDASGFAVSLTTTVNMPFGSKVVAPQSGILLNDQMDDFVVRPGVPNSFGLVGKESNAVAPGKRPLSSMTPTIVLDSQGRVVMVIGASGGPTIISGTLQVLSNILDFGMDPEEAVSVPRMHHQWTPEKLMLDTGYPRDVQDALRARGHVVEEMEFFNSVQVILIDPETGLMTAASDPRKDGAPAAP